VEELLRAKTVKLHPPLSAEASQRLLHELQVHQIELEMQNAELRRTQEELDQSRNKYAELYGELYDFAPIGYFSFDAQGVIQAANLTGAKLLGIERELLAGKPFSRFIADAGGREVFSQHLGNVLQRQGLQRCEIRLAGKDGSVIHGQLQSVMVDDSDCKDGYILSSIVDGTVARHLGAEIQDAREYAENIVETMREPLVVLDSDLKILTANQSFYETFKVTPEETIGNFIYDVGNRQWDVPKLRVLFEEILPHDTVINGYEVEHDFPGIGCKTILLNARQIFRKKIGSRIILLAMEDISERKLAEVSLKNSEEQMRFASTAAEIGMWHWDLVNDKLTWSESCHDLFGFPPDYPVTYGAFLQAVHEEDRQRIDEAVQKSLQEKKEYFVEMRIVIPDDQVRWIMSKGLVFNDDRGKAISMHGIAMDITVRKRAEDKIERLNTKLAERAADLESANTELGAFNYAVSHDLRQPLNNISIACHAIEFLNRDKLNEDSRDFIKIAINGVNRMSNLIETLLRFSNSAHSVMRREMVQLDKIAKIVAANLRMTEPERQVNFTVAEGLTANGDPSLLYIVLENLIGNAWKYTGRRRRAVIEVGLTENNGTTIFFVRDNGLGFNMSDAEQLFIPFKRLPGTTEFIGHGIGLATVERIIRRHDGKVWAEGVPGSGATFYFTLHP